MRQVRAAERNQARDERGPIVQLRTLDERLGDGIGAVRERMRLLARPDHVGTGALSINRSARIGRVEVYAGGGRSR